MPDCKLGKREAIDGEEYIRRDRVFPYVLKNVSSISNGKPIDDIRQYCISFPYGVRHKFSFFHFCSKL
jgi:hypothetical protein